MNRIKDNFLQLWRWVGLLIIILGLVIAMQLSSDKELLAGIVILIGILISIIPYFIGNRVYICPKCKAKFKMPDNEMTLVSRSKGAAILTCPNCKKTNLCFAKLFLKNKNGKGE